MYFYSKSLYEIDSFYYYFVIIRTFFGFSYFHYQSLVFVVCLHMGHLSLFFLFGEFLCHDLHYFYAILFISYFFITTTEACITFFIHLVMITIYLCFMMIKHSEKNVYVSLFLLDLSSITYINITKHIE